MLQGLTSIGGNNIVKKEIKTHERIGNESICNILFGCFRDIHVGVSFEYIKFSMGDKMMRLVDKGLEIGFYPCFHSGPLGEFS